MTEDYVARAMVDAAIVALDARSLMPLQEARDLVRASTVFAKGQSHEVDSHVVLDSDLLWAALLSLEDAAEFVREASRLRWEFHPRGHYNVAPVQRYGDEIEAWLLAHVGADGYLLNVPWCVKPCLLEIGTQNIFRALWGTRGILERPLAARVDGAAAEAPAPAVVAPDVEGLLHRWIVRHHAVSYGELARLAIAGDERGTQLFVSAAAKSPSEVAQHAAAAVGADAAQMLSLQLQVPTQLEPRAILRVLDDAAEWEVDSEGFPWPLFRTGVAGHWEYHALRVVAARSLSGDHWGVLFERVTGCDPEVATVDLYRYGSNVPSGMWIGAGPYLGLGVPEELLEEGEWGQAGSDADRAVLGPDGMVFCGEDTVRAHDLRPGHTTEQHGDPRGAMTIRAYLAHFPDAFWCQDEDVLQALALGSDAEVVVASTSFAHVTGHAMSRDEVEASVCFSPSESNTYRSLAQAICDRDARVFEPGVANTDWRLHAVFEE
ncbi:MAG: hypothetical protein AAF581_12110 [Planctomycetota bacterium]